MRPPNPLMVSVIIPTYNRADLVTQAIDSLLAQTRVPDEIIVVDDGSTDRTSEVLGCYGPPVKVISQTNQGRSAARNAALRVVSGDLIAFLDSDDWLPPESMERRFQYLDAHTHTGLVYSDAWLVSARSEKQALFSEHYPVSHPTGEVFADLIQHNFLLMSTVMVRQTCVAGVKFDESLDHCEDFDFWLKLAVNCRFAYVRTPLAYCRIPEEAFDPKNWGFAGGSYLAYRQIAGLSELQVQQRAIEMPIFQQLSRRQRAKIYCSHGIKKAMLTRLSEARHCFWKAILTAPLYPVSYVLLLASLLGLRVLQALIPFRRHLVGHRSWKRSSTRFPRRKA